MRITGGEWASRRIASPPKSWPVRPSPDALREQAFAVLGRDLAGATFLDLFAGTGVVSFEALSRGAASVVAVERSGRVAELLRRNAATLGVAGSRFRIEVADAAAAVRALAAARLRFPFIWCDPPFPDWEEGARALGLAAELGVASGDTRAVIECPDPVRAAVAGWDVVRRLRGAVLLAPRDVQPAYTEISDA